MGAYTTRAITDAEYHDIIDCIENGYLEHKPNPQIACIIRLEANLGCRINDIMSLTTDSFIKDGGIWKLNIMEQKTKKARYFIVPQPVKDYIDKWIEDNGISAHEPLFTIKAGAVWKALRQVRAFLDLDNIGTHSMRKYCASRLYEATGHDIQAVSQFLNHASTRTTSIYIRRSDDVLENAINRSVAL